MYQYSISLEFIQANRVSGTPDFEGNIVKSLCNGSQDFGKWSKRYMID